MEVLASYPHNQLQSGVSPDITARCLFGTDCMNTSVSEDTTLPHGEVALATAQDFLGNCKTEVENQKSQFKDEKDSDADDSLVPLHDKNSSSQKECNQITYLINSIPALGDLFHLHRKIGEGTFSSVFLATLKNIPKGSPLAGRQFAVKHLIPTTHPSRVERELRCLQEIGGCDNVVGVNLCLRSFDNIAFIMPYLPHRRFSEYVIEMRVTETRNYMKQLLLALRRVHSFNIIHRDVKPSNFLYDRETKQFLLVDFGLSQSVEETTMVSPSSPILQSASRKRKREDNFETSRSTSCSDTNENVAKRPALAPSNVTNIIKTPEKSMKISSDSDNGSSHRAKSLQNITNVNGHNFNSQKLASMSISLRRVTISPSKEGSDSTHLKKTPWKNKHVANIENILSPPKLEFRGAMKKIGFGTNEIYQDESSPSNGSKCALDLRKIKPESDQFIKYPAPRPGMSSSLQRKIIFDDIMDEEPKVGDKNCSTQFSATDTFSRRTMARFSQNSPGTPLPVSGVFPSSGESEGFPLASLSPDQSIGSSKEFRTLVPERIKEVASGSSLIRVQNSQVSPINPSETRRLRAQQDKGNEKIRQNVVFAKPQAPSVNGSVHHRANTPSSPRCVCYGRPQVCALCMARKANNAPRAGTPGFRPPEVLLRSPIQTTAVDMWAVGVILLCILSGCYPFFRSPDDLTALAEIMTVFGTDKIKETAMRLGRMVVCSQPSNALDLKKLCTRMRQRRKIRSSSTSSVKDISNDKCKICFQRLGISDSCICQKDCKDAFSINPLHLSNIEQSDDIFPDTAYHLLARLLDLNADTRITAAEAIKHPFVLG